MARRTVVTLALSIAVLGCSGADVPGPPKLVSSRVDAVRVAKLIPVDKVLRTVTDPATVKSVAQSWALSDVTWQATEGRELIPQYRIEFLHRDTVEAVYYLGTNSYPPEFPCYSICSGWWLGSEGERHQFDDARYLGLPDSVYLYLLRDLQIP